MKPCLLEFCSINSFSEPTKIDFGELLQYGIFGVFGDTGSGKSTVLDCIVFALYGSVFRSRSGSIADIINFGAERAYVNFEFEIFFEGKRRKFRIERELKRKNAAQSVRVYEKEQDKFVSVADGVRDANEFLVRVIGLEQKDFEKCIALPQGEFAQFVKAPRADRLRLIARLFDLENYGEKLFKKVNSRCTELKGERDVLLARGERYASVTEEAVASLKERLSLAQEEEKTLRTALEARREEEKSLSKRLSLKEEFESAKAGLSAMETQRTDIDLLERRLGLLSKAQAAVSAQKERARRADQLVIAEQSAKFAQEQSRRAQEAESRFSCFDEHACEEEISLLSERRTRAEQAEERRKRIGELAARLENARRSYGEEARRFSDFSYETERETIEERLSSLGESDLFEFIKQHARQLFKREYLEIFSELTALWEKHPEARTDLLPLIEKYKKLGEEEGESLQEIESHYRANEQARKEARENLLSLEKRNGLYRAHLERLQQLESEGLKIKEEKESLLAECANEEPLSRAKIEELLKERQQYRRSMLEGRQAALKILSEAAVLSASSKEKLSAARENFAAAEQNLRDALEAGGFQSAQEAETLLAELGGEAEARARVQSFREKYASLKLKTEELSGMDFSDVSENRLEEVRNARVAAEESLEETVKFSALKRDELKRSEQELSDKKNLLKDLEKTEKNLAVHERLKTLLEGNKFMEFVSEEYLESITAGAGRRLLQLTSGRYFLHYDRGFFVGDNLAGGKLRAVYTLSGGETFLVSLSLALALSAEIYAKSLRPIEFFFLDEGFGTLDGQLVDTVMDSLEKLKGEHFSIGIISHVEELKTRIEKKLIVEKATETHGSRLTAI